MIEIKIETSNVMLINTIKQDAPDGVSIQTPPIIERRDLGTMPAVVIIVTFVANVSAGLVAAWLYDRIKDKSTKITINRKEVIIDKGEIRKVIEENIIINQHR